MNVAEIVLPGRYSEYKALYDFVALFADARGTALCLLRDYSLASRRLLLMP